jgi:hypothetical protein
MRRFLACMAVLSLTTAASMAAQQPTVPPPGTGAALTLYLDCDENGCDFSYFQTEITSVSWVRDRQSADVHILVTGQSTGAGGREYTVSFFGLRRFTGLVDTLKVVTLPAATSDDRRKALVRTFRAGLVRYVARTAIADQVSISFGEADGKAGAAQPNKDRWKAWVFEASLGYFGQSEATYSSSDRYGGFEANRVTKQWKTQLEVSKSESRSDFEIDDTTTFVNKQNRFGASALQVKSLGEHWSAGIRGTVSGSTYDNFKRVVRVTPAVEFDVFPYSASTRRQIRVEYNAGYANYAYHDTTINNKLSEEMPIHRLVVTVSAREPWGNINVGANGIGYLNDRELYRLGTFGQASIKLVKGLNLNFFGNYQSIHDQFYLAAKDFTPQEILTRQFQRGTTYRFWGNVNISYTFGSIFNTVVNPRFSGGGFD